MFHRMNIRKVRPALSITIIVFGGTRNERRITRWGRGSPLQDPENTGALTVLAFKPDEHGGDSSELDIWVCVNPDEEDIIESVIGEIIQGHFYLGRPVKSRGLSLQHASVNHKYNIPDARKKQFPSGNEIIQYAGLHYAKTLITRTNSSSSDAV